ncbi:class I SAM-dependent DNA methyltransferase [Denitrificimonas caeni]
MEAVATQESTEAFITKWKGNSGSERSNFQSFMRDLCTLLQLPLPEPSTGDADQNGYVFERFIASQKTDGNTENRYLDLYRRDCFVLEGKQTGKEIASLSHQNAINAAVAQAERYVRGLPMQEVEHGRPPFIIVVDVGNAIYTYSEFTRTGGNYVAFPDPRHHEIRLDDLHKPEVQQRLRKLWLDPISLDPSKHAAKATRQVSAKLAELAKSLEQSGYDVERVASFLKRCLFTMFAEDVELLPRESFYDLLVDIKDRNPAAFPQAVKALWETMNTGGYSERLMITIKRFNGGLFKGIDPIPLNVEQIQMLIDAAKADWRYVEPAIFGTLLERALDPRERHKLGAHYTPRAYVERLVMPTLIDPLREQWGDIRGAAETLLRQGKQDKALQEVKSFHYQLCQTRVLDPACGSANFLYVALEHMKRLEGEVLGFISELSDGQGVLDADGLTVSPHQFLGLEINPRAAQIAELVLWIGYLQWHYRLNDRLDIPEPILKDFKNIECRDALIDYDSRDPLLDDNGDLVSIWDGISMKASPTTGELIPDETGRATVYQYHNPRRAEWPEAEYIIGNPPYIGARRIRLALGDGYLKALRGVYSEIPEHADFVMYWWARAAEYVGKEESKRFGLITTNSLRQTFSRKVVDTYLNKHKTLAIRYVIPDHPWVDSTDGAAVRVSLICVGSDGTTGEVARVVKEKRSGDNEYQVVLTSVCGVITPNLSIGIDPAKTALLEANEGLSSVGYQLTGKGFTVELSQKQLFESPDSFKIIKPLVSGKDITQRPRALSAIDTFGLSPKEIKNQYPEIYQWLLDRVKPEREQNSVLSLRDTWWAYSRTRETFREALQATNKAIVTSLTAKHRVFVWVNSNTICDSTTVMFALPVAQSLGVLSSRVHVSWSLFAGGRLGIGNDSRYNKTLCFETFPFPTLSPENGSKIGELAEQIDYHRKRQQAEHPDLTLTGMYNVLEKLRAGEELTAKEKTIHQQGLLSLLRELHDELDSAVFEAYGWSDLAEKLVGKPGATTPLPDKPAEQAEAEEELLMRLVELNKQRAQEEAQGLIRWLRPEYQAPDAIQQEADIAIAEGAVSPPKAAAAKGKATFPKTLPEQLKALRETLSASSHTIDSLADTFKQKPKKSIEEGLQSLAALGIAELQASTGVWSIL